MENDKLGKSVAIIGASYSGLLAANVLSPYFDKVTLIDRDDIPLGTINTHRRYTPQSYHTHVLLSGGLRALEDILPGIRERLLKEGSIVSDALANVRSLFTKGWLPVTRSEIEIFSQSRSLLEGVIRQMTVERVKNLILKPRTRLSRLVLSPLGDHTLALEDENGTGQYTFDFVVDARGQTSDISGLLDSIGISTRSIHMKPNITYITAWLPSVNTPENTNGLIILPRVTEGPTGGGLFKIENGQTMFTLYGYNKNIPPREWIDILSCSHGLLSDMLYQAVKDAAPDRIDVFKKSETKINYYAKTGDWPHNILVVGDAVSSFNPVYGQGMATSAISLQKLKQGLGTAKPIASLQRDITRIYEQAWSISGNEDLRWPDTQTDYRQFGITAIHRIGDMINRAATKNRDVAIAYIKVLHMLEPPETMFRPDLLLKIFANQKTPAEAEPCLF
ncbi:MAG: hypothetical protein OEZ43_05775 [Gammaproteobacteria bacterium]|nr:hypothetical protein [Gammaproteobacteria bacterium]